MFCGHKNFKKIKDFKKKPKQEPEYNIKNYKRTLFKCRECGHYINKSKVNFINIYKNEYSKISYGQNLMKKIKYIESLKLKSDNYHRSRRIISFVEKNFPTLTLGVVLLWFSV